MLTEANVSRLVNKLTEMRGAALKLGQFLSIQGDSHSGSTWKKRFTGKLTIPGRLSPTPPTSRGSIPARTRRRALHARLADGGKIETLLRSSLITSIYHIYLQQVMTAALGADWATRFASFERIPFAAASIGQVHAGVLAAAYSPTGRDEKVAIKIQFPNVADSIGSDLSYARALLTAGRVLPKGLFLERTIEVSECDPGTARSLVTSCLCFYLYRS
jgi:aarF domain-containing kinase